MPWQAEQDACCRALLAALCASLVSAPSQPLNPLLNPGWNVGQEGQLSRFRGVSHQNQPDHFGIFKEAYFTTIKEADIHWQRIICRLSQERLLHLFLWLFISCKTPQKLTQPVDKSRYVWYICDHWR
jgi:hypothetical protein